MPSILYSLGAQPFSEKGVVCRSHYFISGRTAGFGKGYATYLGITIGYAAISTIPVMCVGRRGLSEGGGIAALRSHLCN